ncbi:MAG: CDP-archaeol synthase [Candidatus Saccharimonadales bacterium]|nr:CDP-archaeol synthase [Candidatus Saccharimonadales bacterium]
MNILIEMLVTLVPVIAAGVLNMVFVKTSWLNRFKTPIDRGKVLKDGKRLFGDNKTWKGFWGMVVLTAFTAMIWGWISAGSDSLMENNLLYRSYHNCLAFNVTIGALLGLAYVVFELPNSYFKRRRGVKAGQSPSGLRGIPYRVFDQIDSAIGVVIVIAFFWPMTVGYFLGFVAFAGIVHIVFNVLLYALKLKKEI